MRSTALALVLVAGSIAGCQTVRTERADGLPVAIWIDSSWTSASGEPTSPQVRALVARALADAGLHATVDDRGVLVPASEERRAREVLLVDKRLAGSGAVVLIAVPAGTGRKTASGFEMPEVAPDAPLRAPVAPVAEVK